MGMAEPTTIAASARQPILRTITKMKKTNGRIRPPLHIVTAYPVSRPATRMARQEGRRCQSRIVAATTSTNMNSRSAMIMCSSSTWKPFSRTGTVARVAHSFGTRARRSSTYSRTPMARPIRCWTIVTRVRLWNGSSTLRNSE